MKRLIRLSVLALALIAVILLVAGPVAAKATQTEFTATETYVKDLAPGREWYTGPNGEIYHWRGNQQLYTVVASDLRVSGDEIITLNLNMKLVDDPEVWATGRMWGTFRIINDGGTWEGTWTGVRDERGFSYIEYVGSGGGGYAGLHIRVHNRHLTTDWTIPFSWTGYILDPGK